MYGIELENGGGIKLEDSNYLLLENYQKKVSSSDAVEVFYIQRKKRREWEDELILLMDS